MYMFCTSFIIHCCRFTREMKGPAKAATNSMEVVRLQTGGRRGTCLLLKAQSSRGRAAGGMPSSPIPVVVAMEVTQKFLISNISHGPLEGKYVAWVLQ